MYINQNIKDNPKAPGRDRYAFLQKSIITTQKERSGMGARRSFKPIFQIIAVVTLSTILITGLPSANISLATGPTPIVAVVTISKDAQGNTAYDPQTVTIKTGEEILILNNDTAVHTFTNGMGPDDQLSGKLFDTGTIEPRGFVEYVASNLQPGTYPFFSMSDPTTKGELVVTD
jgi:plastocyanin